MVFVQPGPASNEHAESVRPLANGKLYVISRDFALKIIAVLPIPRSCQSSDNLLDDNIASPEF